METKELDRKVALITGITGQDGSYLVPFLLEKGYEVHGIIRRSSSFNTKRIEEYYSRIHLHYGDLTDSTNLIGIISSVKPTEIYNLGAQSHVKVSFEVSEYTGQVDALGTLRLLDAVRSVGMCKSVRFYQASTSELYGGVQGQAQNEETPFYPRSPYAVAKLYGYWIVVNYREAYDMHASNGVLFNHESPRRGRTFVTRKITRAVAAISEGVLDSVSLGNLDASRDWGHAKDYVKAMWMMMQQDTPDDYVIATGETHTVREFVERAFACVNMKIMWKKGENPWDEVGVDASNEERVLVSIDPRYYRPTEVDFLLGDPKKATEKLGWHRETGFDEMVREMVAHDIESVRSEEAVRLHLEAGRSK